MEEELMAAHGFPYFGKCDKNILMLGMDDLCKFWKKYFQFLNWWMNVHFTSQYFLYNYYCNGGLKFTVWYNDQREFTHSEEIAC